MQFRRLEKMSPATCFPPRRLLSCHLVDSSARWYRRSDSKALSQSSEHNKSFSGGKKFSRQSFRLDYINFWKSFQHATFPLSGCRAALVAASPTQTNLIRCNRQLRKIFSCKANAHFNKGTIKRLTSQLRIGGNAFSSDAAAAQ